MKTKLQLLFFLIIAFASIEAAAQSNFVTIWDLSKEGSNSNDEISFMSSNSNDVNYTWQELPTGSSGSGTLPSFQLTHIITGLPRNAKIRLEIEPQNLTSFSMYFDANIRRLIDVTQWGSANWKSMESVFRGCINLNITATDTPNLANVQIMDYMFSYCENLNGPTNINSWNTSNVSSMKGMFENAQAFNQNIGSWNTSKVTNMEGMFESAHNFNQNISNWNTSNVTNMSSMFQTAISFNQNISNWNTSKVTNMEGMFESAHSFNQNISNWNTSNVTNMSSMFFLAYDFNQNLGNWQLNPNVNLLNFFRQNRMSCQNYSSTIKGWSSTSATNRSLGAVDLIYNNMGKAYRDILTKPTNQGGKGWTVTGDNYSTNSCGAFITQWDLSKTGSGRNNQITFNANIASGGATYFWKEISPGNAFGFDTLAAGTSSRTISGLPPNAIIQFEIEPTNLLAFNINNGADKSRLIELKNWGTSNWSSLENAFYGCSNLIISASDIPNLSNVTNMSSMFKNAHSFNKNIGNWVLNANANMSNMLDSCGMDCINYSATLYGWNTIAPNSRTLGAAGLSYGVQAAAVRANLVLATGSGGKGWTITDAGFTNATCGAFVTRWDLSKPGALNNNSISFYVTAATGGVPYTWETVPAGSSGSGTFASGNNFNTISGLPSNAIIRLKMSPINLKIFQIYNTVNKARLIDVETWGNTEWTNMEGAFSGCNNLNISATDIPVLSNVQSMASMFGGCTSLNSPANINQWNISNVINIAFMFSGAINFNQNIGNWNTSNVISMSGVFRDASAFNQDIGDWNTANVIDMSLVFQNASVFNQNIGNWNTSKVIYMMSMFENASSFNQNIGNWNTSNVNSMNRMFNNASAFNQNISSWVLNTSVNLANMLNNCGMSCANYTALLIKWSASGPNNKTISATGLTYGTNATSARTNLTSSKGWTITDAGVNSGICGGFVTIWDLKNLGTGSNNEISYNAQVASGGAAYTWQTIPSGSSGSGTMSAGNSLRTISGLPANAIIRLTITPNNLRRFFINNSGNAARLTNVEAWGITEWTSMENAFFGCGNLNITATDMPNLANVTNMSQMFKACGFLNNPANINQWATGTVTNMSGLFEEALSFNRNIGDWNTANVTNMSFMFKNARDFNQNIGNWNTAKVTNMSNLFDQAINFDNDSADMNWNTANVTDMRAMFNFAEKFNRNISQWNTAKVTDMSYMFSDAARFNQPIGNWNTSNVTNMSYLFYFDFAFNQPLNNWNTTNVTDMQNMFNFATSFNQPINFWNTGNVSNMRNMFRNADKFNQPIDNWNISKVIDMEYLFAYASAFNQNIGNWNLNATVNMRYMLDFSGIDCFNYSAILNGFHSGNKTNLTLGADGLNYGAQGVAARNNLALGTASGGKGWTITGDNFTSSICGYFITKWDLSKFGDVGNNSISFNATVATGDANYIWETVPFSLSGTGTLAAGSGLRTINGLPVNAIIRLKISPSNLQRFYINNGINKSRLIDVEQWQTTPWTSMERAFEGCDNLNISAVDTPNLNNVSNMNLMFHNCSSLTGAANINGWNTSNVNSMVGTFSGASLFNNNIGNWNTNNVTNMNFMFTDALAFNQNIGNWNTNNVLSMGSMFRNARAFNKSINKWNTSNVTSMNAMFSNAKAFNQPLDSFNTSSVTNMSAMFEGAEAFNQNIGNWNTNSVNNMLAMFQNAPLFNQNISNWNTANVTFMSLMLHNATSFNQDLSNWTLNTNVDMEGMFFNSGINCNNYSNMLIAWNNTAPNGRNLGIVNRKYEASAVAARANLLLPTGSGGKGWSFSGDALISHSPYLVPDDFTITGNYACEEVVDLADNNKVVLKIFDNGNSFSFSSTKATVKAKFVSSLPAGVSTVNNGGGYYQINNGNNVARLSRRMISIENPNNFTNNGGVIVRIYYNASDTENIVTDAVPAGVSAISQFGWFKSSFHNAQDVVNDLSASGQALPSATQIFPYSSGEENGILYVEFLVQSFSTFGFFAISNLLPLPVHFTNFSAKKITSTSALLKWQTANEVNNSYFEVERSLDGINFIKIGTVKANGTTAGNYQYIDNTISMGTPKAFYRIKQVDEDGKTASTNVQVVNFNSNVSTINVYPNPFNESLNVELDLQEGETASITITDAMGKVVFSKQINTLNTTLNLKELASGIYNITILSNENTKSYKIMKQ